MNTIKNNKRDFSAKGTISNPYTEEEYQQLQAEGKDVACYVEGRGFCAPAAMAPPTNPGSPSDPSDPSDPEPEPSSEPSEPSQPSEPSIDSHFLHLRAGEYIYRPYSFPVCFELKISWDEGDFQAGNQPGVHAEIIYHQDHPDYMNYLDQSNASARWDSEFRIVASGSLYYETIRDTNGRLTSTWRTVNATFEDSYKIEPDFLTLT